MAAERAAWIALFLRAVAAEAQRDAPFTIFEVARRYRLPEPPTHRLWGAATTIARSHGLIRAVAAAPSSRPRTARSLVRVWVGARHVAAGENS